MTRHRPLHGADSAEAWNPRAWKVVMQDQWEPTIRFDVRIPKAIGKNDAAGQARDKYPSCSVLAVEEVVPESATFDEWVKWAGLR